MAVLGVSKEQAKAALMAMDGDMDRAAEWHFSHSDDVIGFPTDPTTSLPNKRLRTAADAAVEGGEGGGDGKMDEKGEGGGGGGDELLLDDILDMLDDLQDEEVISKAEKKELRMRAIKREPSVAEAFRAWHCHNQETRDTTFRKIAFSKVKCHLCSHPLAPDTEAAAHYTAEHPNYRRVVTLEELRTWATERQLEMER